MKRFFSISLTLIILLTFSFSPISATASRAEAEDFPSPLTSSEGLNAYSAEYLPPDFFENPNTFLRSAVTFNESEPNNTTSTADGISIDSNVYGYLGSVGDIDYFVVTTTYDGQMNFWIECPGNSTYNSDFYYAVYGPSGYLYGSTSNTNKLVSTYLLAGTYYIKVYNPNTSYVNIEEQYMFRCKLYLELLNVPAYRQNLTNTCSSASARMILAHHGIFVSEEEIVAKQRYFANNNGGAFNDIGNVDDAINYFLQVNGKTFSYIWQYLAAGTNISTFQNEIFTNLNANYPIQILLYITDTNYFAYQSTLSSHYVVVRGLYLNNVLPWSCLNDPHYNPNYPTQLNVPLSSLWTYGLAAHQTAVHFIAPL